MVMVTTRMAMATMDMRMTIMGTATATMSRMKAQW